MTDELKNIYKGKGALDRFFDAHTPVDLFRGRKQGDSTDLMQPTLIGWVTQRGPRNPDVLVNDEHGLSPQYQDARLSAMVVEGKDRQKTAEILRNADQYVVKGCRTMSGLHRGVSVFDKKNTGLRNFDWYKIDKGTKIHEALAVTRDSSAPTSPLPIHYTVAPKDDMPLSLFLQCLKSFEAVAKQE